VSGLYQNYPFVQSDLGYAPGSLAFGGGGGGDPSGLAGGDLTGRYPDPLVKELSGLGVTWAATDTSKVPVQGGGTFLPAGDVLSVSWKGVRTTALLTNRTGQLYFTKDGGVTWYDLGYSLGGTCRDVTYGKINATQFGWAVVGNLAVKFFADIPANYDVNGNPLQAAWQTMVASGIGSGADICYSASHGAWFFVEQVSGIAYIPQLVAGTVSVLSVTPQGASNNVGGIFVEASSNRLVYFERGTGRLWWAGASFSAPADWTEVLDGSTPILKSIYPEMTDSDGVGSGISAGDTSAFAGNVVIATTDVADPTKYMMAFSAGTLPSLWDISTDGVNWYGTVVTPSVGNPWLYQFWIGAIPSHRDFIAEKNLVVQEDTFLTKIPNASCLRTNQWGQVEAGAPDVVGPIGDYLFPYALYDTDGALFSAAGGTFFFAFVPVGTFNAKSMSICIRQGGFQIRLALYRGAALVAQTAISTVNSSNVYNLPLLAPVQVGGGQIHYMAISASGSGQSIQNMTFALKSGCSTSVESPIPQGYDPNSTNLPGTVSAGSVRTALRPWMAVFG
jgi:hypothetical protein